MTGTDMALAAVGVPCALPAGWSELFSRGAAVNPDPSAFPTMGEIRGRLREDHERLQKAIRSASPDDLERGNEIRPGWKQNATDAVHFFAAHEFYHAGQIALIRRTLGRTGAFG